MSTAYNMRRGPSVEQQLLDDAILLLASAHRASFDVCLRSIPSPSAAAADEPNNDSDDDDDDVVDPEGPDVMQERPGGVTNGTLSESDEEEEDEEAANVPLQRMRWEAVARGAASVLASYAHSQLLEASSSLTTAGVSGSSSTTTTTNRPSSTLQLSGHVGAALSGPACQQRARYVAWKRRREADEREALRAALEAEQAAKLSQHKKHKSRELLPPDNKKASAAASLVSDFNVAKGDRIRDRVDEIMQAALRNLPSSMGPPPSATTTKGSKRFQREVDSDDEDDDDDEGGPVEVYQPPAHHNYTDEELAAQAALHEAEDELMQKVQALQVEHYTKHKRWIDVNPFTPQAMAAAQAKANAAADSPASPTKSQLTPTDGRSPDQAILGRGANSTTAVLAAGKRVEEFTASEVCVLVASEGLDPEPFRRVNGRLLLSLTSTDLRVRMPHSTGEQREALLQRIQREGVSRRPSASFNSSTTAMHGPPSASVRGGGRATDNSIARMLAEAAATGGAPQRRPSGAASVASSAALGNPLEEMKKAMGQMAAGRRPLRPSEMQDEDYEALAEEDEQQPPRDGETSSTATGAAAAPQSPDRHAPPSASRPQQRGGRGGGGQRHTDPMTESRATSAPIVTTAPPQRGNRWAVVEYDDDDDDDSDA